MPELPEVEVVRAGLVPFATGATVARVEVLDERSLRRHPGPAEDFVDRLTGAVLAAPSRRGKYLWLPLPSNWFNGGEALVVHLGMSGQVLLRQPGTEDALTRIRIDLEHPQQGAVRLNFVDQRIFGSMAIDELVEASDLGPGLPGERMPASVAHIARDPLDPNFDDGRFLAALRKRRTGVKRALLDQTLVSGIGNIYADEALWAARIHYDPRSRYALASRRTGTAVRWPQHPSSPRCIATCS